MSAYINKRPYIIINGIDSRTWSNIIVTELPPISKPKIRTQVEEVDGRDGDIITPLGYAAYDKTVKIGLKGGSLGISPSQINFYIGIFNSSGTIIFSDEPTKYYRYAIYEQIDFERLLRYRTAEITFHVQPFKFSTTEAPIVRSGSGAGISANVVNSGNIYSRPELLLTGSGNATVDLNSSEILSVDLDSANGAIFIDSENMNAYGANSAINNVIAYINPVQNLNGYAYPWIGGAGKNKLPNTYTTQTIDGVTFTVNNDGSVKVNGTASNTALFTLAILGDILTDGQSYYINGNASDNKAFLQLQTSQYGGVANVGSDYNLVYSTSGEAQILVIRVNAGQTANNITLYPMIRLASVSDASFEPYENICEITGFTELNIIDNGVNQWNEEWEVGSINDSGVNATDDNKIRSKNYIPIKPSTEYFIVCPSTTKNGKAFFYDNNQTFISSAWFYGNATTTTPSNACYMRFRMVDAYGTSYNNDISINYPATDTSYHAYAGNTYNIDISENPQDPDNPQVVYGGYYESKTGVLNITWGSVDLGNLNYTAISVSQGILFRGFLDNIKAPTNWNIMPGVICSQYKTETQEHRADKTVSVPTAGGCFDIIDSDYSDATAFKTAMQNANAQLVYELAEPIQIQLAPTQINNLIGLNQVFTDTNGDVAVDYRASGEAHFEQAPIVSFTCTFEDIIKGTLLNRAVTGNYDNIKLNIGLNNIVVNGSGVKQLAIDKYSRWL